MKKYAAFYIPYTLFVITLTVLLLVNEKADLHLWLTSCHNSFSDFFFKYYTNVGAWVPYLVVFILLFYKYRPALFVLVAQLLTGLIAQIVKHLWNEPRPKLYFAQKFPDIVLHKVEGVRILSVHSFPSGHTTSAFALFVALAFMTKSKFLQFTYFVLAALVGYSRIYLSQHFAIDVLVGSLIGVIFTHLLHIYFEKKDLEMG